MSAEMKKGFIPSFVSSCVPEARRSGKLTEAQAREYCNCAAEKSATLLSQEEVMMAAQRKKGAEAQYMPKIQQASESCAATMKEKWAAKNSPKK